MKGLARVGEVLTLRDAAAHLALPAWAVYRLVETGRLPGRQLGRQWRFHRALLDGWQHRGRPTRAGGRATESADATGRESGSGRPRSLGRARTPQARAAPLAAGRARAGGVPRLRPGCTPAVTPPGAASGERGRAALGGGRPRARGAAEGAPAATTGATQPPAGAAAADRRGPHRPPSPAPSRAPAPREARAGGPGGA